MAVTPERDRIVTEMVHPDDPRAQPLLADLLTEYDARYGDLFGSAAVELDRYPVAEFLPPAGAFLLLLADDVTVAGGAYRAHEQPGTAEIKRMWTHAAHRRRGLARRVLSELAGHAAAAGYTRAVLTTGPLQPEARALYLSAGWTPLFDPAVPKPTAVAELRRLPVADRLYVFERVLAPGT